MKFSAVFLVAVGAVASTANAASTINVYYATGCAGTALVCSNVGTSFCFTSSSTVFASTRVTGDARRLSAHSNAGCSGVQAGPVSSGCLSPSFSFHSARVQPSASTSTTAGGWITSTQGWRMAKREDFAEVDPENCAEPDSVEFFDKKSKKKRLARIPKGKLRAVEKAIIEQNDDVIAEIVSV